MFIFILYGFIVSFNNISVKSQRCLYATVLIFRVLPRWHIMPTHMMWYFTETQYNHTGPTGSASWLYVLNAERQAKETFWMSSRHPLIPAFSPIEKRFKLSRLFITTKALTLARCKKAKKNILTIFTGYILALTKIIKCVHVRVRVCVRMCAHGYAFAIVRI